MASATAGAILYRRVVKPQLQLLELDVTTGEGERRVLACSALLGEHEGRVRAAGGARGARHGVENVVVARLARVVHREDRQPILVCEALERAHVAVVGRVRAVAAGRAHLLQGVDDHETGALVPLREIVQLVHESVGDAARVEREAEALARRVGEAPHAALDARERVLERQIEHAAPARGVAPEGPASAHGER